METSVSATLWDQAQLTRRPITLDLRGTYFTLDRASLVELPENILLCLFPQGLFPLPANGDDSVEEQDDLYYSEFDPACLSYVLSFFKAAQDDFYGTETQPGRYRPPNGSDPSARQYPNPFYINNIQSPLLSRQAVIALREELEYYAIPMRSTTSTRNNGLPAIRPIDFSQPNAQQELAALSAAYDPDPKHEATNLVTGAATPKLLELKEKAGQALLGRRHIFTALQRNVNKENNVAEQHLIDMLCMSGFDRSDDWGYRALEPSRCSMVSIALVLLKTGTVHSGETDAIAAIDARQATSKPELNQPTELQPQYVEGPDGCRIDQTQMATAQKLLLFWRKPARKCWWDGVDVIVPVSSGEKADPYPEPGSSEDQVLSSAHLHASNGLGPGARKGSDSVPGSEASPTAGMTPAEIALWKSGQGRRVRVWARRIWTLELSLL